MNKPARNEGVCVSGAHGIAANGGSPRRGDMCPKCGVGVTVRPDAFVRGARLFPGIVCDPCGLLWDDPDDSFLVAVSSPSTLGLPLTQPSVWLTPSVMILSETTWRDAAVEGPP